MIDWLSRVPPQRPFLKAGGRTWSYGEVLAEVEERLHSEVMIVQPGLDPHSVFSCLAGMAGGGLLVLNPGAESPDAPVLEGAALVVFTSGTGGRPKGVRLTAANLKAAASASAEHLGHDESDTWLLAMPLNHVGGLSIVVRSVFAGGAVRLLPEFEPASFSAAMRDDVTMVSVVPTMLRRLLQASEGQFGGQKAVLVGGGPIPDGLLEQASDRGLPVLPTYGMTETFGQLATLRPGSPLTHRAHPLPGVEIRIEPDGRIAVKGAQVFPGYLDEPDREDEWFVTNDLGHIDDEGAIRVMGRADTIIVTGGENVDPGLVEALLAAHPGVEVALVVGVPDLEWGSAVACVYTGSGESGAIESWLRGRLPGHMIPKIWRPTDELPRTPLGKPDRIAAVDLCLRDGR